jgi:hypothetical protein
LFGYLLLCAFLYSAVAFINRYPLVYSDSGTYILGSFTLEPFPDRPIGYSFIIRALTWQSTLWTVVLFQGWCMAWLIYRTLQQVLPQGTVVWRAHLLISAVLLLGSSMPWYMAQIMPDAITPMLALVLYLLLYGQNMRLAERAFLWTALFFFMIAHNSHVAMGLLFLFGAALHLLFTRARQRAAWWRVICASAVVVLGVVFVSHYNGRHGLRPVFSPTANVFLAGRLCEGALMGDFLDEHCATRDYALCPFKDELPTIPGDILWGHRAIATRLSPKLTVADSLIEPAVRDLLSEPKYLLRFVRMAFVASITQLFQVNTNTGLISYPKDSAPSVVIGTRLRWEASMYMNSLQSFGVWTDLRDIDRVVHATLFLSLLVLIWWWPSGSEHGPLRTVVVVMLAWVVLNAVVIASLANVYDRLQSRVAWLIVLAAVMVFLVRSSWGKRLLARFSS